MTKLETYQHYKGGLYIKLHEALHTETNETMVVYACAVRGEVFCRPKDIFFSHVNDDNYSGPRFIPVPSLDKQGARDFLKNGCSTK